MCLYSDDSTLPRSLLAASQSVSSNDFSFFLCSWFLSHVLIYHTKFVADLTALRKYQPEKRDKLLF
jgi:hypothetical protein